MQGPGKNLKVANLEKNSLNDLYLEISGCSNSSRLIEYVSMNEGMDLTDSGES